MVHRKAFKQLGERPLTLVRKERRRVFFHTGGFEELPPQSPLTIEKREGGKGTRLWVDSLPGLLGTCGSRGGGTDHRRHIEAADLIIFDLDPGGGLE